MSQFPRSCEWPRNRLGTGSRRRSAARSGCTRLRSFEDRVGQLGAGGPKCAGRGARSASSRRTQGVQIKLADPAGRGHRLANDCRAPLDGEQDTVCCPVEVGSYQGPGSARPATRVSLRCGPRRCFAVTGSLCSAQRARTDRKEAFTVGAAFVSRGAISIARA
jgi:hypothetical protein